MRKACKSYVENGVHYQFDARKLLTQINQRKYNLQIAGKKITKAIIMNELAEKLFVSVEAIKNWMYGYNGPSDLEQVKLIGEYFEIDYHHLLEMEEEEMTEAIAMNGINNDAQAQYTKDRVREIYRAMIDYIRSCRYYFYSLSVSCKEDELDKDYQQSVISANRELKGSFSSILRLLEYSMLDIPEEFYGKLNDYIWVELNDYIDMVANPDIEKDAGKDIEPEYEDYYNKANDYMVDFFDNGYKAELRELFSEYIVR